MVKRTNLPMSMFMISRHKKGEFMTKEWKLFDCELGDASWRGWEWTGITFERSN